MDLSSISAALTAYQEAQQQCTWADANYARILENLRGAEEAVAQRRAELSAAQGALVTALGALGFVLAPAVGRGPSETVGIAEGPSDCAGGAGTEGPSEGAVGGAAGHVRGRRNGRGKAVLAALQGAGGRGMYHGEVLDAVRLEAPGGWTAANVQSVLQRLALDGKAIPPRPYSRGVWRVLRAEEGAGPAGNAGADNEGSAPPKALPLGRAALLAVGRLLSDGRVHAKQEISALPLNGFGLTPTKRHRWLGSALARHIHRGRVEECAGGYRALPALEGWLPVTKAGA